MPGGSILLILTMKKLPLLVVLSAIASCLLSCSGELDMLGMFWTRSETPDQRFRQSMEYNTANGPVVVNVPDDEYRLYVVTDIHLDKTTKNLDRFVSDFTSDKDAAPFCICLGDVINCTGNYPVFMDHISPITENPGMRFFCTPGNHDIYFDQWQDYASCFGTSSYTFEVVTPGGMKDFYLCMDSSSGTLGKEQRKWVSETLEKASKAGYRHITIFTHTHFFKKDGSQGHTSNYEMEETYELTGLFSRMGVDMVLTGHDHSREYTLFKGVEYYVIDSIEDISDSPFYAIATYCADDIDIEYVPV